MPFQDCWQHRQDHDGDGDQVDVLLHELDMAKEVAEDREPARPQHATDHAVRGVHALVHIAYARHRSDEGAHDGHEAGQNDRLGPVLGEELVGRFDVPRFEEPRIGLVEQCWADPPADEVADDIPTEGRNRQQDAGEPQRDTDGSGGDVQAGDEQQGVTGKEEDEQAAFDEDDDQNCDEGSTTELVQPVGRLHPLGTECVDDGQRQGDCAVTHRSQD